MNDGNPTQRCIVRPAPDGCVERVIEMPVTNQDWMDQASIHLIHHGHATLNPEQLVQELEAGRLLRLDFVVRGLCEPRFGPIRTAA